MLGAYIAYTLVATFGRGAARLLGRRRRSRRSPSRSIGALIEALLLKRIYAAPELLQLAATFGVVLIVRDAALAIWGAGGPARPARAGLHRRDRAVRPRGADLRPAAARRRPARAARAVVAARRARASACSCARRPRTACWRARWASTSARLFTAVFALGALPRRARRRAAAAARAGEPRHGSRDHRRGLRRHRRRRPGLDSGRVRRRAADRPRPRRCASRSAPSTSAASRSRFRSSRSSPNSS